VKVYVLGAGASYGAGYPLGNELFDSVAEFVRTERSELASELERICSWLEINPDPLIVESYRKRRFEYLFTILDLASKLSVDNLTDAYHAYKSNKITSEVDGAYLSFSKSTNEYGQHSQFLRLALAGYLKYMHGCDHDEGRVSQWHELRAFGERLEPGDIVITFNYDATLERVLLERGVWSPGNGYGFELVFQRSGDDPTQVSAARSPITILHLHGAVGWYDKPIFKDEAALPAQGAVARNDLTPAPLETAVALAPNFLRSLGLEYVDASMPKEPVGKTELFLYPSFLKDYESHDFVRLWRLAAEALRQADEIVIIGYSLPEPDSAALSLFVTNCDRDKVTIVNQSVSDNHRLRTLLAHNLMQSPVTIQQWLDATA
jgi:hypothetical protein